MIQCSSVMRHVVRSKLGGYERCKTLWCMREHCRFLTVPHVEQCVVELCRLLVIMYYHFVYISGMCI